MASAVAGQPDVVTYTKPRSPAAEAYRTLRNNLRFASLDPALAPRPGAAPTPAVRRLLCVSSGPDEGKSTAVANLAVVLAQAGSKVVVVDADLRRPSQHVLFNLRNGTGLSDLCVARAGSGGGPGDATAGPDLPLQPTAVPNLWLMASGPPPPNPTVLLGSPRMDEILARLTERADVVLIDTPPIVAFADAAILCPRVDGVLLVVGAGTVKRDLLRKAKAQLEAVNAPVLGALVLNAPFDTAAFAPYYPSAGAEGRDEAS